MPLNGGAPTFYVHTAAVEGYTNLGQLLGAAIGPGSNSQFLGLDRYTSRGRWGVFFERVRYDDSENVLDGVAGRPPAPELSMDFEEAVGRLPDGARQVFVLHDIEGYRHEEIADMLGIVPGTSKSQLHHARMALRKHLDR